jgi:tyrosine-specific transport protein
MSHPPESSLSQSGGSLLGGALLVAGTTIGGGMLALPVLTSLGGFIPSLFIYLICWIFMVATGLLLLELSLTYGDGANLVTMADKTLGLPGKIAAWALYLFMFYSLTIAYIVGCGNLIFSLFEGAIPQALSPILFTALFAPFIWAGAKVVGPINSVMMLVLGILYVSFIALGAPYIDTALLQHRNWPLSLIALPIAFTSFAYQGIIPTLNSYLNHDGKKARLAILIGSFLPLITYAIWQGMILGIVPVEGAFGLRETLEKGENAVWPLKHFIQNPAVWVIGQYFAFFALLTSFFGVTLGLLDFLADGLSITNKGKGRFFLSLLVFLPPLIFAIFNPHVFLIALDRAGGYGSALLLGLLPVLMVWSKRFYKNDFNHIQIPIGKWGLIILILFILFEVILETLRI